MSTSLSLVSLVLDLSSTEDELEQDEDDCSEGARSNFQRKTIFAVALITRNKVTPYVSKKLALSKKKKKTSVFQTLFSILFISTHAPYFTLTAKNKDTWYSNQLYWSTDSSILKSSDQTNTCCAQRKTKFFLMFATNPNSINSTKFLVLPLFKQKMGTYSSTDRTLALNTPWVYIHIQSHWSICTKLGIKPVSSTSKPYTNLKRQNQLFGRAGSHLAKLLHRPRILPKYYSPQHTKITVRKKTVVVPSIRVIVAKSRWNEDAFMRFGVKRERLARLVYVNKQKEFPLTGFPNPI